jgi:cell division protein FtsB
MRIFAAVLGLAVVLLQYRVWVSDHGVREVSRLTAAVEAQAAANVEQRERNRQLVAEVNDLKEGGLTALEERARSELGMVGNSETFYQVVTAATPAPAAPSTTITARAQ